MKIELMAIGGGNGYADGGFSAWIKGVNITGIFDIYSRSKRICGYLEIDKSKHRYPRLEKALKSSIVAEYEKLIKIE
jgi:hypothetical protein